MNWFSLLAKGDGGGDILWAAVAPLANRRWRLYNILAPIECWLIIPSKYFIFLPQKVCPSGQAWLPVSWREGGHRHVRGVQPGFLPGANAHIRANSIIFFFFCNRWREWSTGRWRTADACRGTSPSYRVINIIFFLWRMPYQQTGESYFSLVFFKCLYDGICFWNVS